MLHIPGGNAYWWIHAWSNDNSVNPVAKIKITWDDGTSHTYTAHYNCNVWLYLFYGNVDLIPLYDPNGGTITGRVSHITATYS
jgi:hypothetical protein